MGDEKGVGPRTRKVPRVGGQGINHWARVGCDISPDRGEWSEERGVDECWRETVEERGEGRGEAWVQGLTRRSTPGMIYRDHQPRPLCPKCDRSASYRPPNRREIRRGGTPDAPELNKRHRESYAPGPGLHLRGANTPGVGGEVRVADEEEGRR